MMVLFSEMSKNTEGFGFLVVKESQPSFGHIKFEVPVRHPSGAATLADGDQGLQSSELRGEVWTRLARENFEFSAPKWHVDLGR